jgi:LEA14-like dessication related protein
MNVSKYELSEVTISDAKIDFYIAVTNPNNVPLSMREINYNIFLDGADILDGTHEGFALQGQESIQIKLPIKLEFTRLSGPAISIATKLIQRSGSVSYKISGSVKVYDNIGFSVNAPIDIEGKMNIQ